MVKGLDVFRAHFDGYQDRYTIIGGTAVFVAMDTAGLAARATKDLDIVLCIETIDADFASRVWEFVEAGGYEFRQKSTGAVQFYRFHKPADPTFPFMLELFSRRPDMVQLPDGCHLTPVPIAEEVSSLSAILLDDDYYYFVQQGSQDVAGITVLSAEHLVPLKARAWLDLSERKAAGEEVSSNDVKKHRNDILRVSQIIAPTSRLHLPDAVMRDLERFMDEGLHEGCAPADLGIKGISLDDIGRLLRTVYLGTEAEGEGPTRPAA